MGSVAPIDDQSEAIITDGATISESTVLLGAAGDIAGVVADTLDAAGVSVIPLAELREGKEGEEQASDYWTATDMAPLNPASAVSIVLESSQTILGEGSDAHKSSRPLLPGSEPSNHHHFRYGTASLSADERRSCCCCMQTGEAT